MCSLVANVKLSKQPVPMNAIDTTLISLRRNFRARFSAALPPPAACNPFCKSTNKSRVSRFQPVGDRALAVALPVPMP